MRARCPGSTSNLGPGFDVLGLALDVHIEVEAEPAERLSIEASGEGADYPRDETHLAARVARLVAGHDRFALRISSSIPVGRGLGSSAALAAATAAACGTEDPLAIAAMCDGHAENAAASVLGGLVAATMIDRQPVARRLALDVGLHFVVIVPDHELSTERARAVLPAEVPFADAVTNLGRMGILLAGLADRTALIGAAGEDRLYTTARTPLFPEAPALLEALCAAGATIACWSGAGPSLLGICDGKAIASAVRDAGDAALSAQGIAGKTLLLAPDREGLVVSNS